MTNVGLEAGSGGSSCHGSEPLSDPDELRRCIRDLVALVGAAGHVAEIRSARRSPIASPRRCSRCFTRTSSTWRFPAGATQAADRGRSDRQNDCAGLERSHLRRRPQGIGSAGIPAVVDRRRSARGGQACPGLRPNRLWERGGRGGRLTAIWIPDRSATASSRGLPRMEATIALQRWQVEAEQHRFASLIERSSDFVGFANLDGRPQYINPSGLRLVGLTGMEHAASFPHPGFHCCAGALARSRPSLADGYGERVAGSATSDFVISEPARRFVSLVDWFRIDEPRTGRPMNTATVGRDLTAQKRSRKPSCCIWPKCSSLRVAERTRGTSRRRTSGCSPKSPSASDRMRGCNNCSWSSSMPPVSTPPGNWRHRPGARDQSAADRRHQLRQRGPPSAREERTLDQWQGRGNHVRGGRADIAEPGRSFADCATSWLVARPRSGSKTSPP